MDEKVVLQLVSKIKRAIRHAIRNGHAEEALSLIRSCAELLYTVNLYYRDDDLEQALQTLATMLQAQGKEDNGKPFDQDVVLFWDGFGLDDRGLVRIYLKALCKAKHVVYVSYEDKKNGLLHVRRILEEGHAESCFIPRGRGDRQNAVQMLRDVLLRYRPKQFFFYSTPYDVVGTTVMYMFQGRMDRYQINLTDHAFWLGAGCIGKCIEFREYGARITKEYRGIEEKNIVVIPFYPAVEPMPFQGFPFPVQPGQKVFFSGGALYKTMGDDQMYYSMVQHILDVHPDTVFWYAGSGSCSEMDQLLKKYPNRAFFTAERQDLCEVIHNCRFYLSTYPLCGGLMFQYAAVAGRVPVTLKRDPVADSFLIDQSNLGVEFDSTEKLYVEVDKLLNNDCYWKQRAREMSAAVISQEGFDGEVTKLFKRDASSAYPPTYGPIDTTSFRKWRVSTLQRGEIWQILVRKNVTRCALRYYAIEFIGGAISFLWQTMVEYLHAA